ncbi:low temperature requirement protein A [Acetobacter sp.]|jgi:low temperature requirement protein LtrA|uniref:low temperature requirement protein A n=1 Tax=Acetobacter sp. TaxID=440 RepID=UPI0025BC783A|nr:low temperature requirement protein A [Acetobacter sp.]MCH4090815.1 low temperature requirement protein A [Acetobacter sp.]MCI1300469.1 low temperature requirement protein A [Acetobacter sp.]MCI1316329.1 low temperature requirement protein A [Acetobacter sp.]
MPQDTAGHHHFLRNRDGHHAAVTNEELFFDLVYVFAITQLSHGLLHHLSLFGALQTAVIWLAVWLGWQYTGWFTNWFDPRLPAVRGVLFVIMILALLMGAAIPDSFAEHGLPFALCFAAMQVGRSAFVVVWLPRTHPLAPNYQRILAWMLVSALFWLTGGVAADPVVRLTLWCIAALCEYVSPMFGFPFPGLGRSISKSDWTIEGAHLVERCQLFVIVALGEGIMATGLSMAENQNWTPVYLVSFVTSFLGTLAMWWLYFGTSGEAARHRITQADDPGKMGATIHYLHAVLIAGIIVTAVGADLLMENPLEGGSLSSVLVMTSGPVLYLLASVLYRRIVSGYFALSHIIGIVALLALIPFDLHFSRLTDAILVTGVMLVLAWDGQRTGLLRSATG